MGRQSLVPSDEDEVITKGRGFTLIYRDREAISGVTPKLRAVRIEEDEDWGRLDSEVRRHLRDAVFVVFATAREDKQASAVYAIDPIECSVKIIVQRENAHLDITQASATVEHISITLFA